MAYVGVDWASRGWLATILSDDREDEVHFFPSFHSLWVSLKAIDRLFIDIPIGLPTNELRTSDRQTKELLRDAGLSSSLFMTPVREAVYARNLEEAKEVHRQREVGQSISNQAWAIVPSIREIDQFLQDNPDTTEVVYESHPELCFYSLAEETSQLFDQSKLEEEGREQRESILNHRMDGDRLGDLEELFLELTEPDYAPVLSESNHHDDFIDATVLAVSAKRSETPPNSIPEHPEPDEEGLLKGIYY